ncbi:putative monooxygenase [Lasiosphaeria ovina]|uniref:Monooxygenase n=1 Tax=Lasiosphaeria ovina TaxID=92902 RepID=A0AAE0MZX5_9PEZI|nr:putative monooxygenase [Lasiosphaeria ovina]
MQSAESANPQTRSHDKDRWTREGDTKRISQVPPAHEGDYPPRGDLRTMMAQQPLPVVAAGTVDPASMAGDAPSRRAAAVLSAFNAAVAAGDAAALASCLLAEQAHWRDQLALTYHLRSFTTPAVIAASLLETEALRGVPEGFKLQADARYIPVSETLQFMSCPIAFKTTSPAATASGSMLLVPVKTDGVVEWKIWVLVTVLDNFDVQSEGESLLQSPDRQLDGLGTIETDVLIIGGGNAAITLAARLKALGVESIMVERNARLGDNWALRYDSMRFHLPTSSCELPFLSLAKHVVQATGISSQKPYLPPMADSSLYKGVSIHSVAYKNDDKLRDGGAKSVPVIGSANTAFDVLGDCHSAGLNTTIVVRSPTYLLPADYVFDPHATGAYDIHGAAIADRQFNTMPACMDGHLRRSSISTSPSTDFCANSNRAFARGWFAAMAAREPERYRAVAAAGFPVVDSAHPDASILHNLIERGGGHYIDPVAFTATGLRFSDGSKLVADAVIWCTGFSDKNVRDTAAGGSVPARSGPRKIAARLDGTWGVDVEGEIRGMWKRQSRLDSYWVMGGHTQYVPPLALALAHAGHAASRRPSTASCRRPIGIRQESCDLLAPRLVGNV